MPVAPKRGLVHGFVELLIWLSEKNVAKNMPFLSLAHYQPEKNTDEN